MNAEKKLRRSERNRRIKFARRYNKQKGAVINEMQNEGLYNRAFDTAPLKEEPIPVPVTAGAKYREARLQGQAALMAATANFQ